MTDLAAVCARFNAAPFYHLLGMTAESDGTGTARVTLPWDNTLTQVYGGTHGGALMALADAAICVAMATTLDDNEVVATVEISMHFLAPAGARDIVAEGVVTKRGGRLGFGQCVLIADGQLDAPQVLADRPAASSPRTGSRSPATSGSGSRG
jgi:uncharacterized protein (TIGR00369 family)